MLYFDPPQSIIHRLCRVLRLPVLLLQGVEHQVGYEQFDKVLVGLLRRILDNNKRVQEAACSAFATLEEVLI